MALIEGVSAIIMGTFVLFGMAVLFIYSFTKFKYRKYSTIEFVTLLSAGLIAILILKVIVTGLIGG